ncbi:activating signal cointegrator 1 complex subunit 1 [Tribolium castaneum]|uniref:Activating signal cointegrator 1 complex subunit 1-like Protein n=1 Tax=Tribolium castaneum TaxID=7070 RepID=D6WLY4_TRICA|nr:PREDICTED: activating signal cointegrator 1 complex subunit 1 [Tribolium castaneum]EFA03384.1 Activating signal cointegrator 1 complex subunit 1-like Protein [Tribolium castaneum]|eukprot:XP_008193872.1 PREDICTED: activating signal cointegrator 1 complex subunit 1 [Tribolium castaneum]
MNRALGTCKRKKFWIDGTCFELRTLSKKAKTSRDVQTIQNPKYLINKNDEGKFFTSFAVPPVYYAQLKKFPHWDLKILENNTKTNITIPASGNLVIIGENEETITEARDEIHSVLGEIRDHLRALQFISMPTRNDEIITNFNKFKDDILNGDKIEGMHESIFISPLKLHLTVVVFTLLDDHEKLEAIKALQDYKNMILDPLVKKTGPIRIKISGVDCMNTNLKKVDVLYAKPTIVGENEDFNLQKLANDLSDHFYERGLVRTYQDNVKLHMTLINTKYRKESGSPKKELGTPKKKRWVKKQSFDATTIMEKYKDFYFGECPLDAIHLSLMGSVGDDGFYQPISIIKPE